MWFYAELGSWLKGGVGLSEGSETKSYFKNAKENQLFLKKVLDLRVGIY